MMPWIRRISEPPRLQYRDVCDYTLDLDSEDEGMGLEHGGSSSPLRPLNSDLNTPRIDSYRFSMANLEDSQDADLDAILGELSALETQCDQAMARPGSKPAARSRPISDSTRTKLEENDTANKNETVMRTESPDNDSAFSDTVSMLSSESSASSGGSSGHKSSLAPSPTQLDAAGRAKAEKIRVALEKMKEASVKKLFIKAFTSDGSTKSLLVDEKMTCAYVTRLLADKNHVHMDPKWGVVEHLPELYMERVYEDHELLVENLMMWTRDSKNKLLFSERPDKTRLFTHPEMFILSHSDAGTEFDDHGRAILLEEFFSSTGVGVPDVEGPLYLKADSKKGWKKYHFVLRASGLYYYPKEKAKSSRDLVCLATFDVNQAYYGVGWKKKFKSPTDFCFAIKHPRLQQPKSTKYIKYLCAEDNTTLHRWMMGIRLAKHGRHLMDNYRTLMDDLAQEDLDLLAHARSCSVNSIATPTTPTTPVIYQQYPQYIETRSDQRSRASSSSSSGCLSDGVSESAFESEFTSGTIKRKPSMSAKLPLTTMTRQLKEVGETVTDNEQRCHSPGSNSSGSGTLTRNGVLRPSRRRPALPEDSGTLKRHHKRGSIDSNPRTGSSLDSSSRTSSSLDSNPRTGSYLGTAEPNSRTEGIADVNTKLGSSRTGSCSSSGASTPVLSPVLSPVLLSPVHPPDTSPCRYPPRQPSPDLPPPPPDMFESTLSLDSLPPPPPPCDLPIFSPHGGSSLSLLSLPPPPSPNSAPPRVPPKPTPAVARKSSLKTSDADCLLSKPVKKISFSFAPPETCSMDRKPPPPKRSDATRLSATLAPRKLTEVEPTDFLKDLQRVMRKKWQVAQKCKLDTTTTPHEVLGFRDPPPPIADYRETNVSNWVIEHYGAANLYENVRPRQDQGPIKPPVVSSIAAAIANKKRPPPPPPKRSETTHLSTRVSR